MLISVTRTLVYSIVITAALLGTACRQADGPLPPATGGVPNDLGDISRDIWNVSQNDADGPKDLSDDISHYAQGTNGGEAAAKELSRRLSDAIKGKTFKLAQAMPVARSCWVATAGRQL